MPFSFLVINGPNLGCLGKRQPEVYGTKSLQDIPALLDKFFGPNVQDMIRLEFYQSNHEGAIIDRIERAREEGIDGLIVNAGALTHTSLALADCLAWVRIPFIEVHISNVMAREEQIRHTTLLGRYARGIIAGFGILGYALAIKGLYEYLTDSENPLHA